VRTFAKIADRVALGPQAVDGREICTKPFSSGAGLPADAFYAGWNVSCFLRFIDSIQISPAVLNILVVDDEAGTRAALSAVLKLSGHHTEFASDGDEALEMFEKSEVPFDLIITDHMMVRVSGLDLVHRLRERGFKGEIVVLTAYAPTIDEAEYRKLEVAGIMEKPFDIAELRQWLACIHECAHGQEGGRKPVCPPRAVAFCWLKHH
jgi:CheY-like chemotaxis protein